MKITTQSNSRLEHRLQVPMAKAITLPLTIDGDRMTPFAVYVCTSGFSIEQPSDQTVLKVARIIADAINKGNQS